MRNGSSTNGSLERRAGGLAHPYASRSLHEVIGITLPSIFGSANLDTSRNAGYTLDIQCFNGKESTMIVSRVQKWGNSQGLRLPKQVLELAQIAVGEQVEIAVANRQIVVKKSKRPKYDLAELVKRIPKRYKAKEVDWGSAVGREEW